jgi:hypothetical protein
MFQASRCRWPSGREVGALATTRPPRLRCRAAPPRRRRERGAEDVGASRSWIRAASHAPTTIRQPVRRTRFAGHARLAVRDGLREARVARLVAGGQTHAAIGQRLACRGPPRSVGVARPAPVHGDEQGADELSGLRPARTAGPGRARPQGHCVAPRARRAARRRATARRSRPAAPDPRAVRPLRPSCSAGIEARAQHEQVVAAVARAPEAGAMLSERIAKVSAHAAAHEQRRKPLPPAAARAAASATRRWRRGLAPAASSAASKATARCPGDPCFSSNP